MRPALTCLPAAVRAQRQSAATSPGPTLTLAGLLDALRVTDDPVRARPAASSAPPPVVAPAVHAERLGPAGAAQPVNPGSPLLPDVVQQLKATV
jgi:hypothetical protein